MKTAARIRFRLVFAMMLFAGLAHAQPLRYAGHPLVGKLWDMRSRSHIDEATLLARIDKANVLLLGETHDNPVHHELQQKLLQARLESGSRPALLMEQFDTERQAALDLALAGSNRDEALNTAATLTKGWDWRFYRPLLVTALDHKLPVVAANLSRERLRPVVRQGFAAFDAADLKRMAVDEVWSEGRQKYLARLIEQAHCGQIGAELRDGLVRSQRLRDAVMADAALSSIGRGVVGIVGSGHARRDIGVPLYLAARDPAARIYSIGFVEVSPEKTSPEAYETERATASVPYDAIWFTPRIDRPDPCASFGKR